MTLGHGPSATTLPEATLDRWTLRGCLRCVAAACAPSSGHEGAGSFRSTELWSVCETVVGHCCVVCVAWGQDVILPRALDDQTFGSFNSLILFNNVEVRTGCEGICAEANSHVLCSALGFKQSWFSSGE